jgi:predicted RNA-binding Zn-ribbon protein involved in translation (DUF1610 family)
MNIKDDVFKYYDKRKNETVQKMVGPFDILYERKLVHKDEGYYEAELTTKISSYRCFSCGIHLRPQNTEFKNASTIPNVSRYLETPNHGKKAIYECPFCKQWNYKIKVRK